MSVLQANLDDATEHWGILVERVEIKNVRLPEQLQRAMAAEAEATRNARAEVSGEKISSSSSIFTLITYRRLQVIAAEGEQKASRGLKEAATVIGESKFALQLRYLQTLNTISAEKNSTIFFPVPINMMDMVGQPRRLTTTGANK